MFVVVDLEATFHIAAAFIDQLPLRHQMQTSCSPQKIILTKLRIFRKSFYRDPILSDAVVAPTSDVRVTAIFLWL
jgi:hypothetical protein